jgi:precorrin-3B synthase
MKDFTRPAAQGWCPGAHRPMAAADGLLVRVRPRLARLTVAQALGLCELSLGLGSGWLVLTQRANLQLRGIAPDDHGAVIQALCGLDLLESDPSREAWPAILVAPCWQPGDDTEGLATELASRLGELPALPPKFGFAVDAGRAPVLGEASADVRIERARSGALIVRADGASTGTRVQRPDAVDAALGLAAWFAGRKAGANRMRRHLASHPLPHASTTSEQPAPRRPLPHPGMTSLGPVYGAAFGQVGARALAALLRDSGARALRLAPNRSFILEGGRWRDDAGFLTVADDPLMRIDACPGAPSCAAATVATAELARALGPTVAAGAARNLHVSGCAKGCARPHAAEITLVGRDGAFDLVRDGRAWDAPTRTGLSLRDALHLLNGLPDARL